MTKIINNVYYQIMPNGNIVIIRPLAKLETLTPTNPLYAMTLDLITRTS